MSTDINVAFNNKKLTIDFLVPCGGRGGVENVLNDTALYLKSLGIRVRVRQLVYNDYSWPDSSLEYYTINIDRAISDFSDYVPMCEQYLCELGAPDIIIATPLPMLTMIIKLALLNNHMNSKIISWLHGPLKVYDDNAYGGLECLKYADLVMVLSHSSYQYIKKNNPTINVVLVKNPIDFSSLIYHTNYKPECRTLAFIGRLSKEKNVDIIINAIAHTKLPWKLIIIGDGDEADSLKKLTITLNIKERISFLGWKDTPWTYISDISSLILSSSYEGFPLVCLEALANGIPVLSTAVNGVTDIIKQGYNGYIYSDLDELISLLDSPDTFKDILPSNCHNSVLLYDKPLALKELSDYILSVISNKI